VSAEASDEPHESHRPAAVMGAGIAGLELLTAFPHFAAIAMIVGSGVSDAGKLFLLALYCVIYTLPLIAIAVLIAVMGKRPSACSNPSGTGYRPTGRWSSHRSPPRSASACWRSASCS
jgi:cytochrome c biogenesis protein CcdA